jgi:hypothetical protein
MLICARVAQLKAEYSLIPERCARLELELAEHAIPLESAVLDLLNVHCRSCALGDAERDHVEQVMLLPMWYRIVDFVAALAAYRLLLIRVVKHRNKLGREVDRRRWLCSVTGNQAKLESWRAFLKLGDSLMDSAPD